MMYSTLFWYDRLGRMVVSRNTKQYNKNAYSYTLYDALGRISEVGEINESESPTMKFSEVFGDYVGNVLNPNTINDSKYAQWIFTNARTQVTRTFYDAPIFNITGVEQENLRKRVATATYSEMWDADPLKYDHATHYSYDIHGNVKTLWQDNPALSLISGVDISQRFKRIDYDYDLVSGKVNEVTYQPNQPDQFIHRYEYDADNRIKNVKTSRDDVFFDNDASYYYYLHGPLARVEIGEERVQGIDYVYTLQGWIKGVNSNSLDAKVDPGMDGDMSGSNHNFAKDAFGYTLNYFNGDYKAVNPDKTSFETNFIAHTENFDNLAHDAPNLYNGNISSMATTIVNNKEYEVLPQFTMYKYDQLNRLKSMKAFADFNFERNAWEYDGYKGRYENNFEYDANGNIETAVAKNAKGDVIDNQIYNYVKEGYNKQNNRLYCIADDAAITSGKDLPSGQDKFDYEDLLNNNYRYNELGELVYDKQMGIDEITWGNNGKIKSVTHSETSGKYNLKFDYNHTGKRIAKHVYNQNNTLLRSEYYTRDASDNVMAVYRLEVDEQNQEVSYRLRERHIYGSSMLGIDRLELELIDPIAPNNTLNHIVGLKSYTGSNHLGNVLTTFSDKKLPVDENSDGMIDYYQPHIISSSDYAPFGAQLAERSFFSETYPNSFNDKRDDPELGDWQDYGMRMYSPWQRRFPTPDPLIVYGQEYPELSTYQFASNSPIVAIDLDGLEGYQYIEEFKDKEGVMKIRRVVELDIYVLTDDRKFRMSSNSYSSSDKESIMSDLNSQFNKGFLDKDCNEVFFKFNLFSVDITKISSIENEARKIRYNVDNFIFDDNGKNLAAKAVLLHRTSNNKNKINGKTQEFDGLSTEGNLILISFNAGNPARTKAHEIIHKFLNYMQSINPKGRDAKAHNELGGVMSYDNQTDVTQENVDIILMALPQVEK